jgi:hypothetical protein
MKKISLPLLFVALSFFSNVKAQSNSPQPFDLGGSINTGSYTVKPNTPFDITIVNFLPGGKGHYTINQTTQVSLSQPLQLPAQGAVQQEVAEVPTPDPCIAADIAKLATVKTEVDFSQLMTDAKTNCNRFYQAYYPATSFTQHVAGLKNQILTLTITNTDTKQVWTLTFQTETDGQFVTLYGFTFIPYLFNKPHTYYAQPVVGTPGSYNIIKGSSEGIADYAPTISFHYITNTSSAISHSLTAGLGASFNSSANTGISPVVIFGYSLLFHQNFGFNIGIASDLVNKLKGQYTFGQTITTNLESSDLTEKAIGFNPFISIVFRFGSSPFSVKQASAPVATAPAGQNAGN